MTDGPFKNLRLGGRWKQLAEAVQIEAISPDECASLASHALVQHLTTVQNSSALSALEACSRDQLELDVSASVEAILNAREKSPFLDKLKKELQFRMTNGSLPAEVISQALSAAIEDQIGEARNRFEEQLIYERDAHKMSWEAYQQALDKVHAAFDAVDRQGVRHALRAGNKNAFKVAASKKEGLEEGPRL